MTGGRARSHLLANLDENGTIIGFAPAMDIFGNELRGRGYFNYDSDNIPRATINTTGASPNESASLKGATRRIPKRNTPCTACQSGEHSSAASKYSHLEPWVEIWDRGRTEAEIDAKGLRAHGAPKVVNGQIKKIVVTKSGEGMWIRLQLSVMCLPKIAFTGMGKVVNSGESGFVHLCD